MVEPGGLERSPQLGVDPLVGAEHDPDHERSALAGRSERESVPDRRAQPVADASDPTPPADDLPGAACVEDDMDPPPREPTSLVESGLGPSRGDRARSELEHGTLGRSAPGRQLEQDALAQLDAVEAAYLGGGPHREG